MNSHSIEIEVQVNLRQTTISTPCDLNKLKVSQNSIDVDDGILLIDTHDPLIIPGIDENQFI